MLRRDQDTDPQPRVCPEPVRQRHDECWTETRSCFACPRRSGCSRPTVPDPALSRSWSRNLTSPPTCRRARGVPPTGVSAVNVEGSSITPTSSDRDPRELLRLELDDGKTVVHRKQCLGLPVHRNHAHHHADERRKGNDQLLRRVVHELRSFMDSLHNRALIGLSNGGVPSFQFLNLATNTFGSVLAPPAGVISEDSLVDPSRNLLLSASETETSSSPTSQIPPLRLFYERRGRRERRHCRRLLDRHRAAPAETSIRPASSSRTSRRRPWRPARPVLERTVPEPDPRRFDPAPARTDRYRGCQGTHTGVVTGELAGTRSPRWPCRQRPVPALRRFRTGSPARSPHAGYPPLGRGRRSARLRRPKPEYRPRVRSVHQQGRRGWREST